MRIEDTGGNVTYTIDNCDCGFTGGCNKCQPVHITNNYKPSPRFGPNVFYEAPYPKFVRESMALIDAHPEWGVKYL